MRCRYLSYLLCTGVGLLVSGIVVGISFLLHGNLFVYGLQDCFSLFSLGTGLAILAGSLYHPFALLCGADKSEILLGISVISAIGMSIGIIYTLNMLHLSYMVKLILFNGIYLLAFALSYGISQFLYARKEF